MVIQVVPGFIGGVSHTGAQNTGKDQVGGHGGINTLAQAAGGLFLVQEALQQALESLETLIHLLGQVGLLIV